MRYLTSICLSLTISAYALAETSESKPVKNIAVISTNLGDIHIQLYSEQAPVTVKNFKSYIQSSFYKDTIFHRVIPNFMIQGGGFDQQLVKKQTQAPIRNEATPELPNKRGTISMARTSDPHSATSQFFINVVDNPNLDNSMHNQGYAVFGKVTQGMDIADKISQSPTTSRNYMRDVPSPSIVINDISLSVK